MNVESFTQFIDVIDKIFSNHRNQLWFRGQARADWKLKPAIFRGFSMQQEFEFYRDFRLKSASRMPKLPGETDLHRWITLMRHHGLPTRLLDWTTGALIALYFAVSSENDSDGVIFILDPFKLNQRYLGKFYVPFLGSSEVLPILRPPFMNEPDLKEGKVVAVITEEYNLRMLMQQSTFTVHAGQQGLDTQKHKDFVTSLTVDRKAKKKIAKSLSLNGIRRSSLFPDLDNLAIDLVDNST